MAPVLAMLANVLVTIAKDELQSAAKEHIMKAVDDNLSDEAKSMLDKAIDKDVAHGFKKLTDMF